MAIERIDNGNGTTTFTGVSVTIPTIVADGYDVVAVRRPTAKDTAVIRSDGTVAASFDYCNERVILSPRPTWKPPADLPSGVYVWREHGLYSNAAQELLIKETASKWFRSWSAPARLGLWKVHDDGTATYLGES